MKKNIYRENNAKHITPLQEVYGAVSHMFIIQNKIPNKNSAMKKTKCRIMLNTSPRCRKCMEL